MWKRWKGLNTGSLLILCLDVSVNRYIMEDGYLNISDVSHGDQGVYSCVAKTPLDRDTASAFLMVLGEHMPQHQQTPQLWIIVCEEIRMSENTEQQRIWQDTADASRPKTHSAGDSARSTSSDSWDDLIEHLLLWPFLASRDWCPFVWFCFVLLGWFPDVPVAPENLVLSEHKSKSVKLEWIPGDDHNSSPTGT